MKLGYLFFFFFSAWRVSVPLLSKAASDWELTVRGTIHWGWYQEMWCESVVRVRMVSPVFPRLMFSPRDYVPWSFPWGGGWLNSSTLKAFQWGSSEKQNWLRTYRPLFPTEAKFTNLFTCKDADPETAPSAASHDEYKCVENLPLRRCLARAAARKLGGVVRSVQKKSQTLLQPFVWHRHELGAAQSNVAGVTSPWQPLH